MIDSKRFMHESGFWRLDIRRDSSDSLALLADESDIEPEATLNCRVCLHRVSDDSARIEVYRQHIHRFSNPQGFDFRIGCFDTAPGVISEGEPSEYWSWFQGYAWQIVLCARCRVHLGWRYINGKTFFGLILDRLTGHGSS